MFVSLITSTSLQLWVFLETILLLVAANHITMTTFIRAFTFFMFFKTHLTIDGLNDSVDLVLLFGSSFGNLVTLQKHSIDQKVDKTSDYQYTISKLQEALTLLPHWQLGFWCACAHLLVSGSDPPSWILEPLK